ncbi:hypothetical protein SALBM217S_08331 [Streptomyces griseoloalbus]
MSAWSGSVAELAVDPHHEELADLLLQRHPGDEGAQFAVVGAVRAGGRVDRAAGRQDGGDARRGGEDGHVLGTDGRALAVDPGLLSGTCAPLGGDPRGTGDPLKETARRSPISGKFLPVKGMCSIRRGRCWRGGRAAPTAAGCGGDTAPTAAAAGRDAAPRVGGRGRRGEVRSERVTRQPAPGTYEGGGGFPPVRGARRGPRARVPYGRPVSARGVRRDRRPVGYEGADRLRDRRTARRARAPQRVQPPYGHRVERHLDDPVGQRAAPQPGDQRDAETSPPGRPGSGSCRPCARSRARARPRAGSAPATRGRPAPAAGRSTAPRPAPPAAPPYAPRTGGPEAPADRTGRPR